MIGNIVAGTFSAGVAPVTSSYESIATVSVGSGGAASVSFTSIPTDYKHLQIRALYKNSAGGSNLYMTTNSNSPVSAHFLYGNGSSAAAYAMTSSPYVSFDAGDVFHVMVMDILDYQSTSKAKTIRSLAGADANGSGLVWLMSQLYTSTTAISSISFNYPTNNVAQYSQFALYGIKD